MATRSFITKQVSSAFKRIGDLADIAVFYCGAPVEFDFSQGVPDASKEATLTVRGVFVTSRRTAGNSQNASETASFVFPAENAPELENLKRATLRGKNWKVVQPIEKDNFLVTVNLVKEN